MTAILFVKCGQSLGWKMGWKMNQMGSGREERNGASGEMNKREREEWKDDAEIS